MISLAFAAPWALALLALLPLLWRLLKVTPPEPALVRFPAIRLLLGLERREESAASTPLWLLLLRLALVTVLILAAARPLLDPAPSRLPATGALLLVVDDGWAAARDWPVRRAFLDTVLAGAERAGRPVLLLGTAPPADGGPPSPPRLMPAAEARAGLAGLEPKPWPTDRRAALAAVKGVADGRVARTVWLSDGLDGEGASDLARALQSLGGGLELVSGRTGRLLLPPAEDSPVDRLTVTVRRLAGPEPESLAVRGLDAAGAVLVRADAVFEAGRDAVTVPLILPTELRNRLVRLDIEGERGAGAVVLLDERWRRRSVGLVGGDSSGGTPLLDRLYYVERALAPYADLRRGELGALLGDDAPSVLVLADLPLVAGATADRLTALVEQGHVLVRFAGPLLAQAVSAGGAGDPLLPVPLRAGGRALGGVMSWTTPMRLAPFAEGSPFFGLSPPAEVEVKAQVLAEPGLDLAAHTWATLTDGTPLVTARRRGKGWVVLIHTGADAEWGNLALSGLFVDLLRRLVALSQGFAVPATGAAAALAPAELLDGFGRLTVPRAAAAITGGLAAARPGPRHPPGLYGPADGRVAFNLAPRLEPLRPLAPPPGASVSELEGHPHEIDLGPVLLVLALLLALADGVATLWLRGVLRLRGMPALALLLWAATNPARAEDRTLDAALSTRLACIKTFDAAIDRDCLAGLKGLSEVIAERSTANLAEPMMVNPDRDPVVFFPLLYWRISPNQRPLSAAAIDRLNAYMAHGGLIVFDTADEGLAGGGQPAAGADTAELNRLRDLVQGLALPPLVPLAADHVLNRAFYLLKETPGRWDGTTVWIEPPGASAGNDGVSPVVLGGNDWVGAWAVDERGHPLHAVVPGGAYQREMAYRFGVNLVMYALTGNYKADQVHLPAIMERLGR